MRISDVIWPRPVAAICTGRNRVNIMTASFLTPISFNPPMIGVAISPKRYTFELLRRERMFSICMYDKNMLDCALFFGRMSGRNVDKSSYSPVGFWSGIPYLKQSPAVVFCSLVDEKEYGDHHFFVGKALRMRRKSFEPLLHRSGVNFYTALPLGENKCLNKLSLFSS